MALDISGLNYGFSKSGLEEYKTTLKTKLITETSDLINDITEITTALDAGWVGVSKDKFLEQFAEARQKINTDLENEYADLESRFMQLEHTYFEQDNNMMNS